MDNRYPERTAKSSTGLHQLQQENQVLQRRLDDLIDQAYRNQDIMQRHQRFDLQVIASHHLGELLQQLFQQLALTSELDAITLLLFDPRAELQTMLADLRFEVQDYPHLWFARQPEDYFPTPLRTPQVGPYHSRLHSRLFQSCARLPNSVAILPLWRQQRLLGYLNLGCFDIQRFQANMATDFIERLASIIAICLENVINNERLTHIGLTDPLTRVSNRRHVELRTLEEIARARRQNYDIACLFLDLDHFKQINDRYGHQGGDEVLCEVARRIKAELRLSDTLGRLGGEEFVTILGNAQFQDALQVAERIRKAIAQSPVNLSQGSAAEVTVSIGLAMLELSGNQGDTALLLKRLLENADRALYAAKNGGRNQVRCF